mmetsp:Transcript_16984/g.37473  ORF Transcript_16984/g.37473 Transcript_16984/m.37473 type:complete len:531 (+) Transcript_16984:194-1786(+)
MVKMVEEDGAPAFHFSNDPIFRERKNPPLPFLIEEMRQHMEQGRIFEARKIGQRLLAREKKPNTSAYYTKKIDPVRGLIDDIYHRAEHVESLLRDLNTDDDWQLAREGKGVTVHFRKDEGSPLHLVRATSVFNNFMPNDFAKLCSLFVETELMHKWFPGGVMKPATLLSWHSKYNKIIQLNIDIPIPFLSPRDCVVMGSGFHLPDQNAFLIVTKPIADGESCSHCEIPKPAKGVVRMSTESIFYIELLPNNKISFKLIGRDDLKIRIMPTALLNHISQGHLPFDLIRTVHRTIRNFENSPWDVAMRERREYYQEIEDKVHEQLDNWKDMDEQSKKPHKHETAKTAAVGQIKKTAGLISRPKDDQEKGHFQYGDDDEKSRKGRWILGLVIAFAGFAFRQGYIDQLQVRHYSPLLELRLPQNQGMGVMITLLACLLVTAASFRQKLGACSKADHQGEKSTTADVVGFGENPENRKEVIVGRTPTPVTKVHMDSRPRPQSQPQARQENRSAMPSKFGRRLKRLRKVFKRKRNR